MVHHLALEFYSAISAASVGQLITYLGHLPPDECDLLLLIGSEGGNNIWARSAHSALVSLPPRITLTTCGCGTIDSSAVTLFCSGRRRLCMPHTRFQLHQATWQINEQLDLRRAREIAELLESDDQCHAAVIAGATGRAVPEILAILQKGVVWMPADALAHGLIHEVTGAVPQLLEGRTCARIVNVV